METILGFILMVLFICLIIGLLKPSKILKWDKKPNRIKVFIYWLILSIFITYLLPKETQTDQQDSQVEEEDIEVNLPDSLFISLDIKIETEDVIEYLVQTNIPLPVQCMFGIDLEGQEDDDIWIGSSQKVTINKSPFSYKLDISQDELPSGKYQASVSYYHNWGARDGNDLAKKIKQNIENSVDVILTTSNDNLKTKQESSKKQLWVMENLWAGVKWNYDDVVNNLGNPQELIVSNKNSNIVKVFYFPDADMTIFVSKPLKEILTWRSGKTNTL
jgi:hypothetical protein